MPIPQRKTESQTFRTILAIDTSSIPHSSDDSPLVESHGIRAPEALCHTSKRTSKLRSPHLSAARHLYKRHGRDHALKWYVQQTDSNSIKSLTLLIHAAIGKASPNAFRYPAHVKLTDYVQEMRLWLLTIGNRIPLSNDTAILINTTYTYVVQTPSACQPHFDTRPTDDSTPRSTHLVMKKKNNNNKK